MRRNDGTGRQQVVSDGDRALPTCPQGEQDRLACIRQIEQSKAFHGCNVAQPFQSRDNRAVIIATKGQGSHSAPGPRERINIFARSGRIISAPSASAIINSPRATSMSGRTTMRAIWYDQQGAANDVLIRGELPTPEPGPGQVRVRLEASGVNPSDTYRRRGAVPAEYPRVIPNSDGAGVIDKVGEGIPAGRVGERVWLYNGQRNGRWMGTAAEYIALDADLVTPLPDHVSFAEGATLGIPAMTAHGCVFAAGPVQGRLVLVTGGAGAVGHYAVQLAAWAGAEVIATVSSVEKAERARVGGAAHVINYRTEDVAARV